jgi:hypothetical protein
MPKRGDVESVTLAENGPNVGHVQLYGHDLHYTVRFETGGIPEATQLIITGGSYEHPITARDLRAIPICRMAKAVARQQWQEKGGEPSQDPQESSDHAETTERTPLQIALTQACEFAIAHGVQPPITPEDFGIQATGDGLTTATYVDGDHAVTVLVDPYGSAKFGVAELDWIHLESDEDREPCECCEFDEDEHFFGRPLINVYLPGDAPAPVTADV